MPVLPPTLNEKFMNMKNIYAIFLFLSLCFILSCGRNDSDSAGIKNGQGLRINATSLSPNALSNIQVYAFQGGGGASTGAFDHRVYNISRVDNFLTMVVPANTWDFVLLSAESGTLGQPSVPAVGAMRATSKMWECPSNGAVLLSAPEIVTARTGNITIAPGASETTDVSLARNVAMIKVVIKEVVGMKTSGNHTVSLLDVPKSLTWNGGLYPDKTNPEISLLPMRASATISDNASLGTQSSNEMVFIVPAHQGTDFLSNTPQDTTTHKLRIAVDLEAEAGFTVSKSVELPIVPKANKVLEVNLYVKSDLNVEATIHNWVDHNVSADISHTTLQVSKTNVALSSNDTLYVNTNAASSYTLQSEAPSWLTATKIDDNRVVLTANTASYVDGSPRSAYVNVTANNVTKRVKVTQRPDVGTISTNVQSFWVSPTTGNTSRTVTVTSTGPWVIIDPTPATVTHTVTSGNAGNTNVVFTRKEHTGFITNYGDYYGTSTFRIKNTQTLEIITVTANNLFLEVDDLYVSNITGIQNTLLNSNVFTCYGLSGEFLVESKPSWVDAVTIDYTGNGAGNITIKAMGSSDGEEREGSIVFHHKDDPNLKATVKIFQEFYTDTPPFSFFVFKYTWIGGGTKDAPKNDIDIIVQFEENQRTPSSLGAAPFDNVKLGHSSGASQAYVSPTGSRVTYTTFNVNDGLMFWGGDAMGGEGETIFYNTPLIDALDSTYPRYIKLVCYAYWYQGNSKDYAGYPCRLTIFTYDGGEMRKSGTNFSNYNGSLTTIPQSRQQSLVGSSNATTSTTATGVNKLAEIIYDRKKHTARINWTNEEYTNYHIIPTPSGTPLSSSPVRESLILKDDEAAAEAKRLYEQKLKDSQNLK